MVYMNKKNSVLKHIKLVSVNLLLSGKNEGVEHPVVTKLMNLIDFIKIKRGFFYQKGNCAPTSYGNNVFPGTCYVVFIEKKRNSG